MRKKREKRMHLREKRARQVRGVCAHIHVKILFPCDICLSNYNLALRVTGQHLLNTLLKVVSFPLPRLPPPHLLSLFCPHSALGACGGLSVTTCVAKPAFPGDQPLCNSAQVCPKQSQHSCSSLRQKDNKEAED